MAELLMLKLGGSLITDKDRPYTPRHDVLDDLIDQIGRCLEGAGQSRAVSASEAGENPWQLILGHGSGSFGHTAALQHRTHDGVQAEAASPARQAGSYWKGFAEVHFRAAQLNGFVMEALHHRGVPAVAFPPSASVVAEGGQIQRWDLTGIHSALAAGLVPVVYGDVVFDKARGGSILSTEDLFLHLALQLQPSRILLAGREAGVWADFPKRSHLLAEITPKMRSSDLNNLGGSLSSDVTGGMASKVHRMLDLVRDVPGLTVHVFSGVEPRALERSILGERMGTTLRAE
jgi:isopentenyl phosphate kinase